MCCLLATSPLLARRLADMRHPCPPCIPLPRTKRTRVSRRRKQASRFRCCFLPMHAARRPNLSIMLLAGNVFSPCTPHGGRMRSPSPAMHSPFPRIRTRVSRFKKQASRFLSCFLPARLPADESLHYVACWQRFLPLRAVRRTHAFTLARHAFSFPAYTHTGIAVQKTSLPLFILFSPRASPGRRISYVACWQRFLPLRAVRRTHAFTLARHAFSLPAQTHTGIVIQKTSLSLFILFPPRTPPCRRNGIHLTLT